jgi:Regulator of chromosome condensation (RCC1) repeat
MVAAHLLAVGILVATALFGVASASAAPLRSAPTAVSPFSVALPAFFPASMHHRHKRHKSSIKIFKARTRHTTVTLSQRAVTKASVSALGSTVTLASGVRPPAIGHGLVVDPSPSAPTGVVGLVSGISHHSGHTTVKVTHAPLSEIFSSYRVNASGTLAGADQTASGHAHAARLVTGHMASFGPLSPSWSCSGSAPTPHITVDLSKVHYALDVKIPDYLQVFVGGPMKFSVGLQFTAAATCTGSLTAQIPIGDTGLFIEIGPEFSVHAGGAASATFTWEPRITYAFFRSFNGAGNYDIHELKSQSNIDFAGTAEISTNLGLQLGLNAFGSDGISGTLGPTLAAKIEKDNGQTCRVIEGDAEADLTAHAHVWSANWTFDLANIIFWKHEFAHNCSGSGGSGPDSGGSRNGASGGGSGPGGGGPGPSEGGGKSPGTSGGGEPIGGTSYGAYVCARLSSGGIDCWGDNFHGELGDGTTTTSSTPVTVLGITKATAVTAGTSDACALIEGGTIDCWGDNGTGDLGNGTTTDSYAPTQVSGISDAESVSAGEAETCALVHGGTVDCWGENSYGELGDDGTTYSSTPIQVSGITNATEIGVGQLFACARLSSGMVDCWGDNQYGELGDGETGNSQVPVAVTGITNATAVFVGGNGACATLRTGATACWGWLSNIKSSTPRSVISLADATEIAVDIGPVCGLFGSGGSMTCVEEPTEGLAEVASITAHADGVCAALKSGVVDCRGGDGDGELGNGSNTVEASYAYGPVVTVRNAVEVASGDLYGCRENNKLEC